MSDFFSLQDFYHIIDSVVGVYITKFIHFSTIIAAIFAVWSIYNTLFENQSDFGELKKFAWKGIFKPLMIVSAIASYPTLLERIEGTLAEFNDSITYENKTLEEYTQILGYREKKKEEPLDTMEAIKEKLNAMYEKMTDYYYTLSAYLNPINLILLAIERSLYIIFFGIRYVMIQLLALVGPISLALTILDEDKQTTFIKWLKLYGIVFIWGILITAINLIGDRVIDISNYKQAYDFSFSAMLLASVKIFMVVFITIIFKLLGYNISRSLLEKAWL